jgi:hypothetical protein
MSPNLNYENCDTQNHNHTQTKRVLHVVTPDAWEGDWDDRENTLFPEGQNEGIGSKEACYRTTL